MYRINKTEEGFKYLRIEGTYDEDVKFLIKEKNIHSISLSKVNCNFDFSILKQVFIVNIFDSDLKMCDSKSIEVNLRLNKHLNLIDTSFPKGFDFAQLSQLEELELNWHSSYNLKKLVKLRSLVLRKCVGDELPFKDLENLEILELIQGPILSIKGIEQLQKLKALTLFRLNKINSKNLELLSGLGSLEYLHLYNFKDEIDISILSKVKNLKWLVIENCNKILLNSSSLNNFKNLEGFRVIGKTNISAAEKKVIEKFDNYRYGYFLANDVKSQLLTNN